ncbi:MAG: hypothetical protein KW793_02970 [Candidatus Doudnabacteria bacterium]|nr:hypothetical protein [Candidatus Doudnabacteria bacterium]
MNRIELLSRLKEIGIITNTPVTLRSGVISDYYCDMKKAFGLPDILNAIADEVILNLPANVTTIASSGYGGLPFGSVVASRSGKKFTAVRDSAKDHGKGGRIDGYKPTKDDVVVIVDDVLTTGSSIRSTMSGLKEVWVEVIMAIIIVKRVEVELGISRITLFDIDELK